MGETKSTKAKEKKKETVVSAHKSLAHAVIAVMKEVKGMEKNSKVGNGGASSYDGTRDMDVKEVFNKALADNGLCVLPVDIEETTDIFRWQDEQTYGQKVVIKQKQQVFTKVKTTYKLMHADSGEAQHIVGFGHGVDTQDKGAGKATTYAMKNTLLYAFVTPVGKIDDTDTTHSEEIEQAKAQEAEYLQQKVNAAAKEISQATSQEEFEAACKKASDVKQYLAVKNAAKEKKAELDKAKNAEQPKTEDDAEAPKKKRTKAEIVSSGIKALQGCETEDDLDAMWERLKKYQTEDKVARTYESCKAKFNQPEKTED